MAATSPAEVWLLFRLLPSPGLAHYFRLCACALRVSARGAGHAQSAEGMRGMWVVGRGKGGLYLIKEPTTMVLVSSYDFKQAFTWREVFKQYRYGCFLSEIKTEGFFFSFFCRRDRPVIPMNVIKCWSGDANVTSWCSFIESVWNKVWLNEWECMCVCVRVCLRLLRLCGTQISVFVWERELLPFFLF